MIFKQNNSLILKNEPKSYISEAYRIIKKNIETISNTEKKLRTIMVTSAIPQKGMEKFCVNLTLTFAESGRRAIVVDCDFDNPQIHRIFDGDSKPGLINLLVVDMKVSEVTKKAEKVNPNFSYIPAGPIPPNPSIFLGSEKMKKVIDDLKKSADMVVFNARPIIGFSDSLDLANQVDGVVLFLNAGMVDEDAAIVAKTSLEIANARIIGVVLNNIERSQSNYFRYSRKNYVGKYFR